MEVAESILAERIGKPATKECAYCGAPKFTLRHGSSQTYFCRDSRACDMRVSHGGAAEMRKHVGVNIPFLGIARR